MKNKKKSTKVLYLLMILSAVVFVVSSIMLLVGITKAQKEQAVFDEMIQDVKKLEQNENTIDSNQLIAQHYSKLKLQNNDFAGWIKIEGTQLDYPVMHTPTNAEYYLRRSFDKSYSISGTPFMDANCSFDSNAVMIYGHYMKNGTMFATLHNYKDKAFFDEHSTILLDTITERRTYKIVSAFYTEVKAVDDNESFKYYKYIGDLSVEDFEYYIKNVKDCSLYDTGVNIENDDKLLTLSTCSYHHEYGRFVVVAKLVNVEKF